MIISHKHKFIFVKTTKVAGTSVEIFFQQISFSKKEQVRHGQPEIINEEGIVGRRGHEKRLGKQPIWTAHCKLKDIKKKLNNDKLFNEYFKFSVARNPWDRAVSAYYHFFSEIPFEEYVMNTSKVPKITSYFGGYIDDVYFIRFENLKEDVEYVCKKLGLDYDINNFGTYKTEHREHSKHKHYTEYYDDETRQIVAEKYSKDIEYFGYEFGE